MKLLDVATNYIYICANYVLAKIMAYFASLQTSQNITINVYTDN